MPPKPSYAERARNALRRDVPVVFGCTDHPASPEPPSTPPQKPQHRTLPALAIGIAPDDHVPRRIRDRKHATPPANPPQWQFGTVQPLTTSVSLPTVSNTSLDPRGSVSFVMPPRPPPHSDAPPDIPIVSSDPELQVKDFGYGFGDPSKPGYAPNITQEETLARQREWELNKAKERELSMSQDVLDDQQPDQKDQDSNSRPVQDPNPRPRRGTGPFAPRGGFERGAGPFTGHRRGRGGLGAPQNGSSRGSHRGFTRGGPPGPSSSGPSRPPGFGSTPPPHFQPLVPIPDSTAFYQAPRQPPPPFAPPGFEPYSPVQPMQPPVPHLTPPVPMPLTPLHFPLDPIRYYLLGQLEYYLSPQNMLQDFFLRQQLDSRGWIPISLLASFNRVKNLTLDAQLVREVLLLSSIVQVRGNMVRMGGWESFVLPNARESTVPDDVSSSSTPAPPTLPPQGSGGPYSPPHHLQFIPLNSSNSQGPYGPPQHQDGQPQPSTPQSQQPPMLYQPMPVTDARFLPGMQPPHLHHSLPPHHPHALPHLHHPLPPHLHPHQPQPQQAYDVLSPPSEINGLNGVSMGHAHTPSSPNSHEDDAEEEEDDVVFVMGQDTATAWSPERRG